MPYNQQQLGGVLGGALVKDKSFYFGSYEYRRERSEVASTAPAASISSCSKTGQGAYGAVRTGAPPSTAS